MGENSKNSNVAEDLRRIQARIQTAPESGLAGEIELVSFVANRFWESSARESSKVCTSH